MRKHYIVGRSDEERQALAALVSTGKAAAYRISMPTYVSLTETV